MSDGESQPIDAPASEAPKRGGLLKKLLGGVLVLVLVVGAFLATVARSLNADSSIGVGAKAPDFSLPDQNGNTVTLSSVLENHRGAVVAFYPKDFTPG